MALFQAIPWNDSLRLRAHVIDRWRGRNAERLRAVELAVTGRGAVDLGGRRVPTYIVTESVADSSYHTISHVTTARPHVVVRIEHTRGSRRIVSEAVTVMHDPACRAPG